MNQKHIITVILCIALILFSGCSKEQAQTKAPLKIGLVYPLTGPGADLGNTYKEGVELAIKDLNDKRILDRPIELVIEGTKTDIKTAVTAMQKMIDVDDIKIFHTGLSGHGLGLRPVAIQNRVILFGDGAHPNITGGTAYIFRHTQLADDEATKIARKIVELGHKKVGILYENGDFGLLYNKVAKETLDKAGIEVTSDPFEAAGNDFNTQIAKIVPSSDAIIVAGFGPSMKIVIKELREYGFKGDIFVNIVFTVNKIYELGGMAEGIYYTDTPTADTYPGFTERFKKEYGKEPNSFHPIVYSTMELIVDAVRRAGSDDPDTVSRELHSTKEFKGTFDTMTVSEKGDIVVPVSVKQWTEKKLNNTGESQ